MSRSSFLVVSSWKLTTKSVSLGMIFLRRSSSLRLIRPSPRANSARRALDTPLISLFGVFGWMLVVTGVDWMVDVFVSVDVNCA